jgi:hypothetical protein
MLIHLKDFGGLIPKLSDRALPPNHASVAQNTQLYSAQLRGLRQPLAVADLTAELFTVERAYRLYDGSTSIRDAAGTWVAFDDDEVNFVRGALKNDQYDRYYAAGPTQLPSVASASGWTAGSPIYDLGVPAPTAAPTVTPPASGDVDETRAYVYTFVNEWGEESEPSPASVPVTGDITGIWAITGIETAFTGILTPNPLDKIRIYRTVVGSASVDYRFVTEFEPSNPPVAESYNDNGDGTPDANGFRTGTDNIALNEPLPSLGWTVPPTNLRGIVNMANGIMVGFSGRDIYFSEPYRPHTFPVEYIRSVDSNIIGLGVYQSGVVVCTTANPYVATGVDPQSISLTRLDDVEPCLSQRSIVNSIEGVLYASQNGLIMVNQSGAYNVIQPLMTRNEWRTEYKPETSRSAADGDKILTFNSVNTGWIFAPAEPLGYIVNLSNFTNVTGVQTDPFTGEAYIISNDVVYLWNPTNTQPQSYTWRSKEFELPYPVNMGAYRLQYDDVISEIDFDPGYDYSTYNTSRYTASTVITESPALSTAPLHTWNLVPFNGVRVETGVNDSPPVTQFRMPIGGSPLVSENPLLSRDEITVRVYADQNLIYEKAITSNQVQRLPSGFKADKWQVELQSAQNIYSFKLAGTAKELAKA